MKALEEIPVEQIPAAITILATRLMNETKEPAVAAEETLVTIPVMARRLGVSPDYIHDNRRLLPYVVRVGPGQYRCSPRKAFEYVARRSESG